jgi:outer membrane immunogenic protein
MRLRPFQNTVRGINMKKILLGTVALTVLGLAAPASAADLAAHPYVKAPAPAPIAAIYDWTGFYIGINGGGGSAHTCWDLVSDVFGDLPGAEGCHNATGGTFGGQIGYRWQAANWVFGIEGQGNWADFSGSNTSLLFAPDFNRSRIDGFGLITGQIGYAWNNVLFYVKGGAAVTGNKFEAFDGAGTLLASVNTTRWGGTVGLGLEFGFSPNWSLGVEYDHLFMGSRDLNLTAAGLLFEDEHISQDVDIALVRLNYRFGGFGAPVAARY